MTLGEKYLIRNVIDIGNHRQSVPVKERYRPLPLPPPTSRTPQPPPPQQRVSSISPARPVMRITAKYAYDTRRLREITI